VWRRRSPAAKKNKIGSKSDFEITLQSVNGARGESFARYLFVIKMKDLRPMI